jgi:hypothetical protein
MDETRVLCEDEILYPTVHFTLLNTELFGRRLLLYCKGPRSSLRDE